MPTDVNEFPSESIAFDVSGEIQAIKSYSERDIIELMVRAPACPEWFEPDMIGVAIPEQPPTPDEFFDKNGIETPAWKAFLKWERFFHTVRKREKLTQWPRAYAIMVLEAK